MSDTRLIEEVRRYPPDVIFPYPWKVEPSPQVDDTLGWSVLDADGTEIFTVHDEEVANALAAVPQFLTRIEVLENALLLMLGAETDWENGQVGVGNTFRVIARAALYQNTAFRPQPDDGRND